MRSRRSPEPTHDVVVALNYYAPYVSGVTEAARVVAEGLAERGHRVLVVCGRHDPTTPTRERRNGVDVLRTAAHAHYSEASVIDRYEQLLMTTAARR